MGEPSSDRLTDECGHHCVLFTVRPELPPTSKHCGCPECHGREIRRG